MIKALSFIEEMRRKKSAVPTALVLSGKEEFLRSEARAAAIAKLGDEVDVVFFDWTKRDADAVAAELMDELSTATMFGSGKAVVVEAAEDFLAKNGAALASFLRANAPASLLVIEGESLFAKRGKSVKLSPALTAVEEGGGAIVDCAPLYDSPYGFGKPAWDSELTKWVIGRFKERGKSIAPQVAHRVHAFEIAGLRGVAMQVEKIVTHVEARAEIRAEDVDAIVGGFEEGSLFEVVDAFGERALKAAVQGADALFRHGIEDAKGARSLRESEIAARMVPLLAQRLRELGRMVELTRGGADDEDAAKRVLGAGRSFLAGRMRAQIRARSPRELGDAVVALAELDHDLKASGGSPRDLLMRFIVAHCREAAAPAGKPNPFAGRRLG